MLADGMDLVFDPEKSHGPYIHDARSGKEYLDLFSFFASRPLAYNHPKLKDESYLGKMAKWATDRPSLSDVYTQEFAEFVERFAQFAKRDHFKYFFFVEGGALGVENALKAAFDWKVRKNLAAGRGELGKQIIHFKQAFHGRTGYTLSLTNTDDPRKHMYFAKFPWPRITNPKVRFPLNQTHLEEAQKLEQQAVEEIEKALKEHPHDIAGLLIEPIQSEGGDNHFRPEFLKKLREMADEHEFLLIFDEVQTGMGLTGKVWAWEHFDVKPDLMSFGKKAQIAGCAAGPRLDDVKDNVFHESSRINSTWGGNLLDMIRCTQFIKIIEEDQLVQNAAQVGSYFLQQLQALEKEFDSISNVRGRGLMIAFDLPDGKVRNQLQENLYSQGAIILPCGEKSLRMRPHLDFRKEYVDLTVDFVRKVAKKVL